MRIGIGVWLLLTVFSIPSVFAQQSLSDLDLDTFQDLTGQYQERTSTNPFAGGAASAEDLTIEDLALTGTAVNASNQYALISGYLVRIGDRIAGFRVEKIEKGRVLLRRLDEVFVLSMGGGI